MEIFFENFSKNNLPFEIISKKKSGNILQVLLSPNQELISNYSSIIFMGENIKLEQLEEKGFLWKLISRIYTK